MALNRYGHVDLRVSDIEAALPFYSKVLPALGFPRELFDDTWKVFGSEGELPEAPFFSITEDPDHRPNGLRIAFWVESTERFTPEPARAGAGPHGR